AAEAVSPERHCHFGGSIGRRLNEYRNPKTGKTKGVGNCAFIAEVGQSNDDAIHAVGVLAKQSGATFGFLVGFDSAVFALLRIQGDSIHTSLRQGSENFLPA